VNSAFNIPLSATPPQPGSPVVKPFGVAIGGDGNAWVTDNASNTVSVISPSGTLLATLPGVYNGATVLTHPVGNASDLEGNIWVANSDWLSVPCPGGSNLGSATDPSITLYDTATRTPSTFTGGGLTVPWGIAVDGNDTVWAFNFGSVPPLPPVCAPGKRPNQYACAPTGISHFCGETTTACPAGLQQVGAPISPKETGYQSDALVRITGGQIDPSGNIWVTGNWKMNANPFNNPGANSVTIVVGAAAPVKTPLIGPPNHF
jgi:hypothetical protein